MSTLSSESDQRRSTHRDLFLYLGRRGPISRWLIEISEIRGTESSFIISRQNESAGQILAGNANTIQVDTFASNLGALLRSPRIFAIREVVLNAIHQRKVTRVINLMPHVWTPFLAGSIRSARAQYVVIAHDAFPHPGDQTGRVHRLLMRDLDKADRIVALSQHVANQLAAQAPDWQAKTHAMFLPNTGVRVPQRSREADSPVRFLHFGRLMPYKGSGMFVEACQILRQRKLDLEISVVGEGDLGELRSVLEGMGARVVNRWVPDSELTAIIEEHDVIVVPNIEASQSGVVATAIAAGRPVIVTPVGGLLEQVAHGCNGLVAEKPSPEAIAYQMSRLILDRSLLATLERQVEADREKTSMRRFLAALEAI